MKTTGELASLGNLIERVRVAMVTTAEPTGMLRSCPLLTLASDDEDRRLWFFVSSTSDADWMHRGHRRVGIAYADPNKQDYASLSGSAAIVRDPEKMRAHWDAWVELWFPLGIDDPDLALLRVDVEQAEYWEAPGVPARRIHGDVSIPTIIADAPSAEPGRIG